MKNARRSRGNGGKSRKEDACKSAELIAWATYKDPEVRKTVVRINNVLSLPPEHFEASKLRLELKKLLGSDSWWPPPRPTQRLSSRSPS